MEGGASEPPKLLDLEREERFARAVRILREVASRHSAFIAGQELGDCVPVTVAIRTAVGIVTGDWVIPKNRWDPALFLQFLQTQDERQS